MFGGPNHQAEKQTIIEDRLPSIVGSDSSEFLILILSRSPRTVRVKSAEEALDSIGQLTIRKKNFKVFGWSSDTETWTQVGGY